ncbi:MAG: iron ABC transporter permease [Bacteroidetes bacterium QS_9_68_14]|nr:MAG: iron ABC transporter permease [Bacteroidetes bacterium QS_9_68_14]
MGVAVPVVYLVLRALEADPATLADLVWRGQTLRLLGNTVLLTAGVLALTTAISLPMAWLMARTDLPGRRLFSLLGVLPLAVPGYVMAYALMGATGRSGMLATLAGIELPRLSGYAGALLALSFSTFPYLFLNLRAALRGLDPALEEQAQALGMSRGKVFWRVVLPQLRPAFLAGGLLIVLHVLGDFGVVSLMRYDTFSYALYVQYTTSFDRIYAAWLALMLLALTAAVLFAEARLLRGLLYHRAGSGGAARPARRLRLGNIGRWVACLPPTLVAGVAVGLPLAATGFWWLEGSYLAAATVGAGDVLTALADSAAAAAPAAGLAALLAVPVAYLSVRRPSPLTRAAERTAYFGYATPPLAMALALIFFTLRAVPGLYQTLALLVGAYALRFLAEAIGPVRAALYQAPPRLEEAARALGRGPVEAFFATVFPLLRRGLVVSVAFVFLSAMKELPLALLLSPTGFRPLAVSAWGYAEEALFAQAAPFALVIIAFSAAFVGLLLWQEGERKGR